MVLSAMFFGFHRFSCCIAFIGFHVFFTLGFLDFQFGLSSSIFNLDFEFGNFASDFCLICDGVGPFR